MKKPLEDIRVLDLTHVWYGPWCTMMLGQLGAEVIKIEPPWGSLGRISEIGQLFGGASSTFHHLNLNKKDMAMNLKDPRILKIFKDLVKMSDVVVTNFVPGTMERLGIGYETLSQINPGIIYASLSGFGETGPYKTRPSYAMIAESLAGFTRQQGDNVDPEGPPYSMTGAFGDLAPGTLAAMSIIAALRFRDKTGKGQKVDVAQFDAMFAYNVNTTAYFLSGKDEKTRREELKEVREARRKSSIGGIHPVKDGHIYLMGFRAKGIENLKTKLGVEEIEKDKVLDFIKKMTRDEASDFFAEVGLPCAKINYASESCDDPHLQERNMILEIEHPLIGKYNAVNFPVKFSESPGEVTSYSPLLGEHNDEILKNYLKYSDEEIETLYKEGALSKNLKG